MSIHTFLNEHEIKSWAHVSDKELDLLYQEVRELSNYRILLQEKHIVIKRFLKKPVTKTVYTLYNHSGGIDAQIINFAQDHKWSINTSVTASYIYSYFYGYFNGHFHGKHYELNKSQTKQP